MSDVPRRAPQGIKEIGRAPGPRKQFWWDLLPRGLPDRFVPPRSGLDPPAPDVAWITEKMAEHSEALEQSRRAHDLERARAEGLEKKASSIATLCLSLLATALAIGGYELAYVREGPAVRWWLLVPAGASVVFLVLATVGALEIQRVGVYQWEGAEPLGREPGGLLGLVQAEEKGRQLANWTAGVKANTLLQMRAWLSRSLVALVLSSLVAIGIASRPTSRIPGARPKGVPATRPASGSSTTVSSVSHSSTTGVTTTR